MATLCLFAAQTVVLYNVVVPFTLTLYWLSLNSMCINSSYTAECTCQLPSANLTVHYSMCNASIRDVLDYNRILVKIATSASLSYTSTLSSITKNVYLLLRTNVPFASLSKLTKLSCYSYNYSLMIFCLYLILPTLLPMLSFLWLVPLTYLMLHKQERLLITLQ